ncbi:MAG TPA: hypothetical protein ENJ00_01810, partial [Phycisphaerales bacterium]|nr:hypothetical protein [Phycisphaerales bacterium]
MIPEDPSPMSRGGAFGELVGRLPIWLAEGGPDDDVVLSSRVRLARNVAGHRFTPKASADERRDVLCQIREGLTKAELVAHPEGTSSTYWFDINELDTFQ